MTSKLVSAPLDQLKQQAWELGYVLEPTERPESPDISHLVTEDDTPVDNLLSEKQQRLLVMALYSSLSLGVPFLAAANVGLFHTPKLPAIVPDVMLSLNVTVPEDWSKKENRSYFIWEMGKPPEIAIEIVSNQKGEELGSKLSTYATAGVAYYVVFDPLAQLGPVPIRAFELRGGSYVELARPWFPALNLGLRLWSGDFEGRASQWLRWEEASGQVLLTGDELAQEQQQRAEQEMQRAEQEMQRADLERQRANQQEERANQQEERANQEKQRADRLADLLRQQGIDLETLNPDLL